MVTYKPEKPYESGYTVKSFREKPDRVTAESYLAAGQLLLELRHVRVHPWLLV